MLGRTALEASTCWDFPTQSDGHSKAGDVTFNLMSRFPILRRNAPGRGGGLSSPTVRWRPRLDYLRRISRRILHCGGVPVAERPHRVVRADGYRGLGPASRSIGVADVGASGASVQLLPSRFQVPVQSTNTGWGWFRSRIEVSSMDSVEPAARLIVQSYERVVRRENGRHEPRPTRLAQDL